MSEFPTGEKIFKNLVEYPLPSDEAAVGNFVFIVPPTNTGYGEAANDFFTRFYNYYEPFTNAQSLEAIIDELYNQVTNEGITTIHEVIIVTHASLRVVGMPVVNTIPSNQPIYNVVSLNSLAQLQKDFQTGQFSDFNTKRKAVIKFLKPDSWITLRCCNFGQNASALYAVYSFFGGFANVYAPTHYQFFSSNPLKSQSRVTDKNTGKYKIIQTPQRFADQLEVHEHLVRQRFFPNDNHTPSRIEVLIETLVDPAFSSEPFTIATKEASDTTSSDAVAFDNLVQEMNGGTLDPQITQKFSDAGFTFNMGVSLKVYKENIAWAIDDTVLFNDDTFQVQYEILIPPDDGSGTQSIMGSAILQDLYSDKRSIPFQLFLTDEEDRKIKGWLFFIITYSEDPTSPPENATTFQSIVNLLNAGQFSGSGVNIKDYFTDTYVLGDSATVSVSAQGDALNPRTWKITDTVSYLIKLENSQSTDGIAAHALSVYANLSDMDQQILTYNIQAQSDFGVNSDIPGTELMAYLDQNSLDDLLNFTDFIRSSYDPKNVVYLNHAQEALQRKKEFLAWYEGTPEQVDAEKNANINGGYASLSMREREDNLDQYYSFQANEYWAEVKCSNPSQTTIQEDLFSEEMLTPDGINDNPFMPNSPYANLSDLRKLESNGLEKYFVTNKNTIEPTARKKIDCDSFRNLLIKIKALGTTDPDEILASLGDYIVEWDTTLKDYLTEDLGFNSIKLVWDLLIENLAELVDEDTPILGYLAEKVEGEFGEALGLTLSIVEVFLIEKHIIEDEEKTDANFERKGKITGVRQWATQLQGLTYNPSFHFTPPIAIDPEQILGDPAEAYYVRGYYNEQQEELLGGIFTGIGIGADSFKTGFDEGWNEIQKLGNDVLDKMNDILDQAFMKSGLDPCMIVALRASGLMDMDKLTNIIMRKFGEMIRDKMPGL